jgi:hypothetical protein
MYIAHIHTSVVTLFSSEQVQKKEQQKITSYVALKDLEQLSKEVRTVVHSYTLTS